MTVGLVGGLAVVVDLGKAGLAVLGDVAGLVTGLARVVVGVGRVVATVVGISS